MFPPVTAGPTGGIHPRETSPVARGGGGRPAKADLAKHGQHRGLKPILPAEMSRARAPGAGALSVKKSQPAARHVRAPPGAAQRRCR